MKKQQENQKYPPQEDSKIKNYLQKERQNVKSYITDLSAYNQGFLIGKFCSLPMDSDELKEKITDILKEGAKVCGDREHEEFFITDYE